MKRWFFRTLYNVCHWWDSPSPLSDYQDTKGTVVLWITIPFAIIYVILWLATH